MHKFFNKLVAQGKDLSGSAVGRELRDLLQTIWNRYLTIADVVQIHSLANDDFASIGQDHLWYLTGWTNTQTGAQDNAHIGLEPEHPL